MRAWKILIIGMGLLLVAATVLVWVVWRRSPVPTLTFIGYTNRPYTSAAARVLFRNGSQVPLEILPRT